MVDPLDGVRPGTLVIEAGRIADVIEEGRAEEPLLFPGFVDLQVYEPTGLVRQGVTGYLQALQEPRAVEDPRCLGLHLEGPFLNPQAAGAIPVEAIRPVDLELLSAWLDRGDVRLVTLAPEIPDGLEAIAIVAERAIAAVGHTRANGATARAAVELGARFATHVWNAMPPLRGRATGPIAELLLDPRVTLGLIADGRHLHPRVEELTVRVAGPARIALTSDLVAAPGLFADGRLKGGDRAGAALVRRMARLGLTQAAQMASLTPATLLGLSDRGRLVQGFRADVAVLSRELHPLQTLVAGEIAWDLRYPQTQELGRDPA